MWRRLTREFREAATARVAHDIEHLSRPSNWTLLRRLRSAAGWKGMLTGLCLLPGIVLMVRASLNAAYTATYRIFDSRADPQLASKFMVTSDGYGSTSNVETCDVEDSTETAEGVRSR